MTVEVISIAQHFDNPPLVVAPEKTPPLLRVDISGWQPKEIGAYLTSAEINGFDWEVWDNNDRLCLTITGNGDAIGLVKCVSNLLNSTHK